MYKVLLLGSGNSCKRFIRSGDKKFDYSDSEITKIDIDPNCGADIILDMDGVGVTHKLPFDDNTFDEIGAYNCLEHWGRQGDWRGYFKEFEEYHRILKDGGEFCCTVPINVDAIADPGHTRFFSLNHFGFLNQNFYEENIKQETSCTDYRHFWKKNFDMGSMNQDESHLYIRMVKA